VLDKFVKEGIFDPSTEPVFQDGDDYRIVLNTKKIPIITQRMVKTASAASMAEKEWELLNLQAAFKVYNFYTKPRDSKGFAQVFGAEAATWLQERGLTDFNGYKPDTTDALGTDKYVVRELTVKIPGFSSLPDVEDTRERMENEKKIAKDPSQFGKGAIQGVAGPESANNAAAQTSFIPMLTLGIPPNPVMALMIGAMVVMGITPGPKVMTDNPDLFWGLIASMWIGNLMLIILNLPLIGIWIKLLTVPYRFLFPAIIVFCGIGLYTLNNNNFDVFMAAGFGIVGYLFYKLGCEPAPLLLGFILGPMMEENLRRALLLSRGDWTAFITRPLSAGLLLAAVLMIVVVSLPSIKKKREEAFQEE
jgi:hypothetical protein